MLMEQGTVSAGWFRAMRTTEARELIKANPFAFILAWIIADRSRYSTKFNQHNLALGEAFIGDFENYGMSEQQYRTAKAQLEKWNFAAFKPTNKGTVAKLSDTRLFSIFRLESVDQSNEQLPVTQRTLNEPTTTNKIHKSGKNAKNRGSVGVPAVWKTESVNVAE